MNTRLKDIRKAVGLNQSEFCKPLNISRGHLAGLETGVKNLTPRLINDICKEYNVNKDWLVSGEGDMFLDPLIDFQLSPEIEEFVRLFLEVDDETKEYVKGLMQKTISK